MHCSCIAFGQGQSILITKHANGSLSCQPVDDRMLMAADDDHTLSTAIVIASLVIAVLALAYAYAFLALANYRSTADTSKPAVVYKLFG